MTTTKTKREIEIEALRLRVAHLEGEVAGLRAANEVLVKALAAAPSVPGTVVPVPAPAPWPPPFPPPPPSIQPPYVPIDPIVGAPHGSMCACPRCVSPIICGGGLRTTCAGGLPFLGQTVVVGETTFDLTSFAINAQRPTLAGGVTITSEKVLIGGPPGANVLPDMRFVATGSA